MRGETCPGSLGTKTTDVKKTTVRAAAAAKRCQRERERWLVFWAIRYSRQMRKSVAGWERVVCFCCALSGSLGWGCCWGGWVRCGMPLQRPSSRGPASEPLNRAIDRPATKKTASIRLGLCPLYASGPVPARRSSLWGMWGLMRPTNFLHRNQGQHHPIPLFLQHHPQTDPRHQQTATRQPGPTSQPPN